MKDSLKDFSDSPLTDPMAPLTELRGAFRRLRRIWRLASSLGFSVSECLSLLEDRLLYFQEMDELYEAKRHAEYPEWLYER